MSPADRMWDIARGEAWRRRREPFAWKLAEMSDKSSDPAPLGLGLWCSSQAGRGWHWDAQNGTWTEPKAVSFSNEDRTSTTPSA